MSKTRANILIDGRVQGVWFRAYTRDAALGLGLTGWVRNLPDGRVEALVEGDKDKVDEMIQWCHRGSPHSKVESVDVKEGEYKGEFEGFKIRF